MASLLTLPFKLATNIFRIGGFLLVTELDALISWSLCSGKQYLILKIPILGRVLLKHDSTRAETRFRLSAKRTSPFKSAGASVQSAAGS
jgi:uncharacterized membrane protein